MGRPRSAVHFRPKPNVRSTRRDAEFSFDYVTSEIHLSISFVGEVAGRDPIVAPGTKMQSTTTTTGAKAGGTGPKGAATTPPAVEPDGGDPFKNMSMSRKGAPETPPATKGPTASAGPDTPAMPARQTIDLAAVAAEARRAAAATTNPGPSSTKPPKSGGSGRSSRSKNSQSTTGAEQQRPKRTPKPPPTPDAAKLAPGAGTNSLTPPLRPPTPAVPNADPASAADRGAAGSARPGGPRASRSQGRTARPRGAKPDPDQDPTTQKKPVQVPTGPGKQALGANATADPTNVKVTMNRLANGDLDVTAADPDGTGYEAKGKVRLAKVALARAEKGATLDTIEKTIAASKARVSGKIEARIAGGELIADLSPELRTALGSALRAAAAAPGADPNAPKSIRSLVAKKLKEHAPDMSKVREEIQKELAKLVRDNNIRVSGGSRDDSLRAVNNACDRMERHLQAGRALSDARVTALIRGEPGKPVSGVNGYLDATLNPSGDKAIAREIRAMTRELQRLLLGRGPVTSPSGRRAFRGAAVSRDDLERARRLIDRRTAAASKLRDVLIQKRLQELTAKEAAKGTVIDAAVTARLSTQARTEVTKLLGVVTNNLEARIKKSAHTTASERALGGAEEDMNALRKASNELMARRDPSGNDAKRLVHLLEKAGFDPKITQIDGATSRSVEQAAALQRLGLSATAETEKPKLLDILHSRSKTSVAIEHPLFKSVEVTRDADGYHAKLVGKGKYGVPGMTVRIGDPNMIPEEVAGRVADMTKLATECKRSHEIGKVFEALVNKGAPEMKVTELKAIRDWDERGVLGRLGLVGARFLSHGVGLVRDIPGIGYLMDKTQAMNNGLGRLLRAVDPQTTIRDINISGGDISGIKMSGVRLTGIKMVGCNVSGATLDFVKMRRVNAVGSNFTNMRAEGGCDFGNGVFGHVLSTFVTGLPFRIVPNSAANNFEGCDFNGGKFGTVSFAGANLNGATLKNCEFQCFKDHVVGGIPPVTFSGLVNWGSDLITGKRIGLPPINFRVGPFNMSPVKSTFNGALFSEGAFGSGEKHEIVRNLSTDVRVGTEKMSAEKLVDILKGSQIPFDEQVRTEGTKPPTYIFTLKRNENADGTMERLRVYAQGNKARLYLVDEAGKEVPANYALDESGNLMTTNGKHVDRPESISMALKRITRWHTHKNERIEMMSNLEFSDTHVESEKGRQANDSNSVKASSPTAPAPQPVFQTTPAPANVPPPHATPSATNGSSYTSTPAYGAWGTANEAANLGVDMNTLGRQTP